MVNAAHVETLFSRLVTLSNYGYLTECKKR